MGFVSLSRWEWATYTAPDESGLLSASRVCVHCNRQWQALKWAAQGATLMASCGSISRLLCSGGWYRKAGFSLFVEDSWPGHSDKASGKSSPGTLAPSSPTCPSLDSALLPSPECRPSIVLSQSHKLPASLVSAGPVGRTASHGCSLRCWQLCGLLFTLSGIVLLLTQSGSVVLPASSQKMKNNAFLASLLDFKEKWCYDPKFSYFRTW